MEAKLKSLKVADLRDVCTRANVSTTTRSTKADLISKILASQPAIDAYNAKYQQNGNALPPPKSTVPSTNDDLLTSPEEIDWSMEDSSKSIPAPLTSPTRSKPNSPAKAPPTPVPASPPKPTTVANDTTQAPAPTAAVATPADEELEKRKARAARFGIALVEPSKPKPKPAKAVSAQTPKSASVGAADVDPEKLNARAQRFGTRKPEQQTGAAPTPDVTGGGKKRRTAVEEVDAEEQERRRKRAERFGVPVVGAKA